MTCIVGIEHKGLVYVGGDSAGTSGDFSQRVIGDKKVFRNGDMVFGVCGLPKVMDVLRDTLEIPKHLGGDGRRYITNELVPEIKRVLKEAGCIIDHPQHGECFHGSVLFGYDGKLYNLQSNLQVLTNAYGFDAVGAGQDIAIGSLHATKKVGDAKARIVKALEASAINNATVRPPFTVLSTKRKRGRLF